MTTATTKPPRARKKPVVGPLRLVTDNLSAQDKELLRYFHAIAHQYRSTVVNLVQGVSMNRPLVDLAAEPAPPGISLVSACRP